MDNVIFRKCIAKKKQHFYENRFTSISRAEFYKNNVNHIFRVSNMEKEKIGKMENIIKRRLCDGNYECPHDVGSIIR